MFAASHQLIIQIAMAAKFMFVVAVNQSKRIVLICFAPCALRYAQTESDRSEAGLFQVACWDNVVDLVTSKVYWFFCRLSEARNIVYKRN